MDGKSSNPNKPLRNASNKVKDLYNAYLRNDRSRAMADNNSDNEKDMTNNDNKIDMNGNQQADGDNMDPNAVMDKAYDVIVELEKERNDLREQVMRAAAEFENFRRRSNKEKQDIVEYANEKLLNKMLPLLDDMSAAIDAGKKKHDSEALLAGIEMIYQKAVKMFEDAGVKQMDDPVGKPFDVDYHDAMMHIPSELPEGHVVQVAQPGYMLREKVLRHAKVITSAGQPE